MKPRTVVVALALFFGSIIAIGLATQPNEESEDPTAQVGRLTQMEQSGEVHGMLEEHRITLEQMQAHASPACESS